MGNEEKKEYLNGYKKYKAEIRRIESDIEEVRSAKSFPSAKLIDGMPHGQNNSDLAAYAAKLDKLERDLLVQKELLIKEIAEIKKQINLLKDENEKDVLYYRYIKNLSWAKIAELLNYTERWLHEIHKSALHNFEIPAEKTS